MEHAGMSQSELEKVHAEIAKLIAESIKLNEEARKFKAETGKITREMFWYPMAVATGLVVAVASATTLVLKLLGS